MKNIKVNALASLLVNILNIVFPLITNPYLTRILSKSNYGYFNTAYTWASFVIPLAAFGIYNYGIRAISKVKDDKNKINYVFSKLFYISVLPLSWPLVSTSSLSSLTLALRIWKSSTTS